VPDEENAQHFTGTKKCAGAKYHKGACADWCFAEAITAERLLCANRVLSAVFFVF